MSWKDEHYKVICDFMVWLNTCSNYYVLKGGTALMLCYNLNRFSEDIDLDGVEYDIEDIVKKFCILRKYTYRVAKDTLTVKRYMVHYGSAKPLKVEVSYRAKKVDSAETTSIKGILVYNIQSLLQQKINAYSGRDKIRDLHDMVFIGVNYWNGLNLQVKSALRNALEYKGLDYLDYLLNTQADELIDSDYLLTNFITLWEMLGLR
jgi:predicted nucleotidyltransferase component of viral defense system